MTDIQKLIAEARTPQGAFAQANLVPLLADVLEKFADERDEAARLSHHFRNERDRYRVAIETALRPQNIEYGHIDIALSRVHGILTDALNPPEIVLSYTEVEDMQ